MLKKFSIVFLLFIFCIPSSIFPNSADQKTPLWWEIKIHLITDGEYKIEQKETSLLGNYSFTLLWTGCMETDDEDYIIYHEDCILLDWKASEKKVSNQFTHIKSTEDFKEKPTFHFNYILRNGENLHFDFNVQEFPVPQDKSISALNLCMPTSRIISESQPKFDYESFITKGSNNIFLEEKEIYVAPLKREFSWTWKQQKWSSQHTIPTRLTNLHKVKVKVSIEPRY